MQGILKPKTNIDGQKKLSYQIFMYTAVFTIMALGIYCIFILNDKTFLRYGSGNVDGLAQRYIFIVECKRFLASIFSDGQLTSWDWSMGLGADAYAFNIGSLFNPFTYFTILFPEKYMDIGYTYAIILRIYFSGIVFLLFARKVKLNDFQQFIGSIIYTFSPWIIISSINQGQFLTATILLPLVMLGIEKVLRNESPVFFIIIVAYTVLTSFNWAYVIGIISVLYFVVRYATNYRQNSLIVFIKALGRFVLFGLVGILTSSIVFVNSLIKYGNATIATGKDVPVLFAIKEYLRFPSRLTCWETLFENYSHIGVSAICLIMIPVIIYCMFKKKSAAIMTGICMIMAFVPFFNSMFNFFSYMTGRWYFVLIFFFTWATVECLDKEYLSKKPVRMSIIVTFALYLAYIVTAFSFISDRQQGVSCINCVAAIILIILILWKYRTQGMDKPGVKSLKSVLIIAVLAISIIAAYNYKFQYYVEEDMSMFVTVGAAYELLNASPQRVGQSIDDDDFYRIDQIEGINKSRIMQSKINEAMYFGNRSVYLFTSSIRAEWFEYNKLLGNNTGYYKRTSPNSNDNRMGMDLLLGVKYFIGNDNDESSGASDYAGYGFKYYDTIDGVDILKSKYSIGLGTTYEKYMTKSDWLKLSYLQREEAMLQAAVVPDDYAESLKGYERCYPQDIETGTEAVAYKINENGSADIDQDKKEIKLSEYEGSFDIGISGVKNSQIVLSIKNLDRKFEGQEQSFNIYAANDKIRKNAANTMNSEQGFPDIEDYNINLGYSEDYSGTINVKLTGEGTYTYDDIKVYAMPVDIYDKYGQKLQQNRLDIDEFKSDYIKGSVESDGKELLYLSILNNGGWDVYVDGEKADIIKQTNVAFIGVELSAGKHTVELRYHTVGLLLGAVLTVIGIIVIIIIARRWKVSRKSEAESDI